MSNMNPVPDDTDNEENPAFTKRISPAHLTEGMYVQQLDRPWTETPFLFQGFMLKEPEDIEILRELCEFVFINIERGLDTPHTYQGYIPAAKVNMRDLARVSRLAHPKAEL